MKMPGTLRPSFLECILTDLKSSSVVVELDWQASDWQDAPVRPRLMPEV